MFIEEKTMHKSMKDLDILTAYIILAGRWLPPIGGEKQAGISGGSQSSQLI